MVDDESLTWLWEADLKRAGGVSFQEPKARSSLMRPSLSLSHSSPSPH